MQLRSQLQLALLYLEQVYLYSVEESISTVGYHLHEAIGQFYGNAIVHSWLSFEASGSEIAINDSIGLLICFLIEFVIVFIFMVFAVCFDALILGRMKFAFSFFFDALFIGEVRFFFFL